MTFAGCHCSKLRVVRVKRYPWDKLCSSLVVVSRRVAMAADAWRACAARAYAVVSAESGRNSVVVVRRNAVPGWAREVSQCFKRAAGLLQRFAQLQASSELYETLCEQ